MWIALPCMRHALARVNHTRNASSEVMGRAAPTTADTEVAVGKERGRIIARVRFSCSMGRVQWVCTHSLVREEPQAASMEEDAGTQANARSIHDRTNRTWRWVALT